MRYKIVTFLNDPDAFTSHWHWQVFRGQTSPIITGSVIWTKEPVMSGWAEWQWTARLHARLAVRKLRKGYVPGKDNHERVEIL